MKKIIFFLIISFLIADTNTTYVEKNETNKTNININLFKKFNYSFFKLPINAKAIDKIVVKFYNSSGKIEEKIINLNKLINPNDEFIISKSPKPQTSTILDVSVTAEKEKRIVEKNLVVPNIPVMILKYDNDTKIALSKKNILKIITKNELKSSRMDFFRKKFNIEFFGNGDGDKNFIIDKFGFKDVNITSYLGYYKLSFNSLDGNFSAKKVENGYEIIKD